MSTVRAPGAVLDDQLWAASWGSFLRAICDPHDRAGAKRFIADAWSERVPAEGGFLVPESLRQQVVEYMTAAVVRPQALVLPMSTLRFDVPVLDNPSQASGAQALGGLKFSIAEPGATITATTPAFGRAVLEARKLAAYLTGVPNELIGDAADAFGDYLARIIAIGLAWYEDDLFIYNGTGAGQPQSLFNAGCAYPVTRTNSGDPAVLADIVAMYKALHPASKQGATMPGRATATWLLSASAMDALLDLFLIGNSGGTAPTVQQFVAPSEWFSAGNDETGASLLGMPAVVTDHQPASGTAGDIILADLSYYAIGDRLELTVERSQDGAGFGTDTSNYRIKTRLDGRYLITNTTTTEAGQTVSPVVVLQ